MIVVASMLRATYRRAFITALASVSWLLALVSMAGAQEASNCPSFQACLAKANVKRWTELASVIETSANNLSAVQKALTAAHAAKDPARVAALEPLLERATADWEAKRKLAETLSGLDYRGYLLLRAADLNQRLDQAQLALQRKTDQFKLLNQALQAQNTGQVEEMHSNSEEEHRAARSLLWNSVLGGLKGAIARGERMSASRAPIPPTSPPQPRPTLDWAGLAPILDRLKVIDVGKEAWEGDYSVAAGKLGELTLEALNDAGRIGPINTAVAQVGAVTGIVEVGSGVLSLAQIYDDFEAATNRQRDVLELQRDYQFEIYRLGEIVKLERSELGRANEAIARQAVFEAQFEQASKQVKP